MSGLTLNKKGVLKWAKVFSIIGHPGFVPTYIVLLLINIKPMFLMPWSKDNYLYLLFYVLVFSLIMPVLIHFLIHSFRIHYDSNYEGEPGVFFPMIALELPNKKDRLVPLIFSSVSYFFWYYTFQMRSLNDLMEKVALGGALVILVVACISYFYKISIHALGMGILIGFMVRLFIMDLSFWSLVLNCVVILLGGFVISARLKLKAHTGLQVLLGFLCGLPIGLVL